MDRFFDIDGSFFRFLTRVADFIILDILVLIFCIPVITIGPALTAAYYVGLKEVKDEEGAVIKSFWKAFKENFKQGFFVELILIVAGAIIYNDISITYDWAYSGGGFLPRLLFFALMGFGILVFAMGLYVFPMIARFENSVRKMVVNATLMSIRHLPQTIVLVIINGALVYFTYGYPLFILLSIGVMLYVNSYVLVRIFALYVPKANEEDLDKINMQTSDEMVDE